MRLKIIMKIIMEIQILGEVERKKEKQIEEKQIEEKQIEEKQIKSLNNYIGTLLQYKRLCK